MRLSILGDYNRESGLGQVTIDLSRADYKEYFAAKNYGNGLLGVAVIFMCRNPALNFKQRVRLSKKKKILYMDIMLDLPEMKSLTHEARRRLAIQRLSKEVPETLFKYEIPDFDKGLFTSDLKSWLDSLGWI
jgi:hypothetical protein